MENSVKSNLRNWKTWERFLYMVLFAIVLAIMDIVLLAVVLLQVALTLITGSRNERASKFGGQLGIYVCQMYQFLTYYSEDRPFPFSDWPSVDKTEESPSSSPPQDKKPTPKPAKRTVSRKKKETKEIDDKN